MPSLLRSGIPPAFPDGPHHCQHHHRQQQQQQEAPPNRPSSSRSIPSNHGFVPVSLLHHTSSSNTEARSSSAAARGSWEYSRGGRATDQPTPKVMPDPPLQSAVPARRGVTRGSSAAGLRSRTATPASTRSTHIDPHTGMSLAAIHEQVWAQAF
jgi:hypothetical protein